MHPSQTRETAFNKDEGKHGQSEIFESRDIRQVPTKRRVEVQSQNRDLPIRDVCTCLARRAPTPRAPTFSGFCPPPFGAPTLPGPSGPHPSGPHPSGPHRPVSQKRKPCGNTNCKALRRSVRRQRGDRQRAEGEDHDVQGSWGQNTSRWTCELQKLRLIWCSEPRPGWWKKTSTVREGSMVTEMIKEVPQENIRTCEVLPIQIPGS